MSPGSHRPAFERMLAEFGPGPDGKTCGECRYRSITTVRDHPGGSGHGVLTLYHCRVYKDELPPHKPTRWLAKWPACARFKQGHDPNA